jgi:hypothetical protein
MKMKNLLSIAIAVCAFGTVKSQDTLLITTDSLSGNDAMIRSMFPSATHGNGQGLQIGTWTWSQQQGYIRSLIQFDLSSVPDSMQILSARMILRNDPLNNNDISEGVHSSLGNGSNQSVLYLLKSPWDQDTVTWSNCPDFDTSNGVVLSASDSATQTYYVDVTPYINQMYLGNIPNNGFIIKQVLETRYAALMFAASEHVNSESRPSLEVVYKSISTVGVSETDAVSLSVYPNPADDIVTLDLGNSVEEIKIRLTNLVGKEVFSKRYSDVQSIEVPLNVPSGIYLLRAEFGDGKTELRKLVKQ